MTAGNIFLSAAILFNDNTFQRIKEICHTNFNAIQKKNLLPAIHRVYTTNRQLIIGNAAEKRNVDLLGDGRCNFSCYNAKYGTYTALAKNYRLILNFNVSHVRK